MFKVSIVVRVGNGENTLFWEDCWLNGSSIQGFALSIVQMVIPSIRRKRTVAQALTNDDWILDIQGQSGAQVVEEVLRLGNRLQQFCLSQGEVDSVSWCWETSGHYSAKSAYEAFFTGSIRFPCADAIWKAQASLKYKVFMWLAIRRRCSTADRLRRRGLQNQGVCVFCRLQEETIDHLLVGCAVTAQIWARFIVQTGSLCPVPSGQHTLQDHWLAAKNPQPKNRRKQIDECIILVSWMLWKERNQKIFNNIVNSSDQILQLALQEHQQWCTAAGHRLVATSEE